jgi:hypothetical protein
LWAADFVSDGPKIRHREVDEMGAIAEAIVEYARPLMDASDGSEEQMNKALMTAQLCFNLAISSAEVRRKMLDVFRRESNLNDEEYVDFEQNVVAPMIRRHEQMFPGMHRKEVAGSASLGRIPPTPLRNASREQKPATVDRYAPCPCGSGKKYKFCCGAPRR